MKKQLIQILICSLALVFIATLVHAYSAPMGTAGTANTYGPLDTSSVDQTKAGGLTVGTFQDQGNALFMQNTLFNGLLRGGSAASTTVMPVTFGGPSNKVDVAFTGGVSINGTYQSNTLKTGGGKKPLCANPAGVLYICGTTPPVYSQPQTVNASAQYETFSAGQFVVAKLSQSVSKDVQVSISATSTPLAFWSNFYTAHAVTSGVCHYTSTPTSLGTVTVYAGSTDSSSVSGGTLTLASGCNSTNTYLTVTSVNPTTVDNKTITYQ